jgi:hypothetical protein
MKKTRAASRRIRRVWTTWPLSEEMSVRGQLRIDFLTEQDEASGEGGNRSRVTRLLHDGKDDRDGSAAKQGGEGAETDVRHLVDGVAVADVCKIEFAIKADEPARKPEEELCERWVDVEVVLPEDVERGELAKVDLVEAGRTTCSVVRETIQWDEYVHNLIRVTYLVEPQTECDYEEDGRDDPRELGRFCVTSSAWAVDGLRGG